jgi:acyl-CoA dehydrogenase
MNTAVNLETADLQLLRDMVGKFCEAEIAPHYEAWEAEGIMPREVWNRLGEAGFLCADVPEEWGGPGGTFLYNCLIVDELARRGYAALVSNVSVHSDIIAHYLLNHGTDAQKQRYLPKMATGECVGAIGMTEPGAGSDLQNIRTVARRAPGDDGWVVNGSKIFITNGQHADLVVAAVKTDTTVPGSKGTSLLLIETASEGFRRGRNLDKIGMHAGDTSELFFEDVFVPDDAVLGELGEGFRIMMRELPRERLVLALGGVGAMQGALEWTKDYVLEREAFGQPVAKFQNTRFRMAEMTTQYRLNRAFMNECIASFMAGELDAPTASMAKLAATEAQCEVIDGCLQLFGGYGYMREYPIARAFADARVQRIYGGTSEIMKELISRQILGR